MNGTNDENGSPAAFTSLDHDTDWQTQLEKKLDQAKRFYATLSQVNQTIMRAKDREALYQSICDVGVRFGKFTLAGIGLLDEASGDIQLVAASGLELEDWPFLIFNLQTPETQDILSVTAVRTGRLVTSEDLQSDPRTQSLHSLIEIYSFRSLVAVPFQSEGKTIGVLNLLSHEAGLFKDEEEVRLLEGIGLDISFALEHIEIVERYRTTLDHKLEGCQIIDFDWRYVYVNEAAAAQGRSTPAELLDHTVMEMYPGIEDTALFSAMRDCMENRTARVMENEFIYADGTSGWFELRIQPAPEGIFILSADITRRKQAEEKQRASEHTLKLFVENAPAGIAMFDREMHYLAASRRYSFDYRLDSQDLVGRSHYDVFPEIPEHWKEIHRRCLAGAHEFTEEDPFPRTDGTLDWVRWEIHPWHERDGEVGGIILFSEVITERKLAHETIKESEE